jgi:hypothetical protein
MILQLFLISSAILPKGKMLIEDLADESQTIFGLLVSLFTLMVKRSPFIQITMDNGSKSNRLSLISSPIFSKGKVSTSWVSPRSYAVFGTKR